MTPDEFLDQLYEDEKEKEYYGIFPPPTDAQHGLNILIEHFLGKDWYASGSMHTAQVNSEAIHEILKRYPKKKSFSVIEYLKTKIKDEVLH